MGACFSAPKPDGKDDAFKSRSLSKQASGLISTSSKRLRASETGALAEARVLLNEAKAVLDAQLDVGELPTEATLAPALAKIEAAKAVVAKAEAAPGAAVPEQLKLDIAAAAQAVQEAIGAAKGWEPSAATLDAAVAVTQGGAKLEKVVSAKRGDDAAQGALARAAFKVTEAHDALEKAVVAVMDAGGATAAQRADAAAKVLEAQDSLGAAIKLAPQASLKELGEIKEELAKAATAASAAAAAS